MDALKAITERRSIKSFDPKHKMTQDEIDSLLSHALLSPTAFNIQNWRYVLVSDPQQREQLKEAAWGQSQVTDCSLLIVLCADLKAWSKSPERYWRNADEDSRKMLVSMIHDYYGGKEQIWRDEAMRSCGIAAQTLMIAAKAMGYDTNPMDGFDFDKVSKIINLPSDHIVTMFVAVGKSIEPARARGGQLPLSEVIVNDRF